MRLFVAVDPGAEVVSGVERAIAALRPAAPGAKWVKAEALHLTLAFLGERDPGDVPGIGEALSRAAAGHGPIALRLRGGGVFGRPQRPRVLWAGCEGEVEALAALRRDVVSALAPLGYRPDREQWSAHLTLARAREQGGDRRLTECIPELAKVDFGAARIEEVRLYESELRPEGPRYRVAASARLAG